MNYSFFLSFQHKAVIKPTLILIFKSSVAASAFLSVNDKNRILSRASEALEINSRRNICKTDDRQTPLKIELNGVST